MARDKTSSWGLLCEQGKLLFVRRSMRTSRPGQWCLPGGGCHVEESSEQGCVREFWEEVGLRVVVQSLLCTDDGFSYFLCKRLDKNSCIELCARECSEYRWVEISHWQELWPMMEFSRMQRVMSLLLR